jgi:hypothetical protein
MPFFNANYYQKGQEEELDPERIEYRLAKTKFKSGKHKDKTYQEVREKYTEYFVYLLSQPAGSVYQYLEFINYCITYLKVPCLFEEDFE